MTNDDLKKLRTAIKEEVSSVVDEKLNASEKRLVGSIVDFVSDHLNQLSLMN